MNVNSGANLNGAAVFITLGENPNLLQHVCLDNWASVLPFIITITASEESDPPLAVKLVLVGTRGRYKV